MKRISGIVGGLLAIVATPAFAGPMDGTWRADTKTAKLSTKPDTFTTMNGVYDCTSCTPPYKIVADGKVHPVAGRDYWDAASVAVVDASKMHWQRYRKGAQVSSTDVTVSADGNMLTFTSTSADNAAGKSTTSSTMARRVAPPPAGAHATSGSWVSVSDGAQIAEENLTLTMSMKGDVVTMKLGTGETYTAKLGGPKVPFVGDKANAMVSVAKSGAGFVETDYINGQAVGTYTYTPVDATTVAFKSVNLKSGTTDEITLKKQ